MYIWLTISSCYGSIPLALGLIGRGGGLSTLCHSCRLACQQRVLKMFPGPGCVRSEDGGSLTMAFTGKCHSQTKELTSILKYNKIKIISLFSYLYIYIDIYIYNTYK